MLTEAQYFFQVVLYHFIYLNTIVCMYIYINTKIHILL